MLPVERIEAVALNFEALVPDDAYDALSDALNEAIREEEESWRARHDPHAPTPLQFEPFRVDHVAMKRVILAFVREEIRAFGFEGAVASKQIPDYAVPFSAQSRFWRQRWLNVLEQLFRSPNVRRFRQFFYENYIVADDVNEEAKTITTTVYESDLLTIPPMPKSQNDALRRALVQSGVSRARLPKLMARVEAILSPSRGETPKIKEAEKPTGPRVRESSDMHAHQRVLEDGVPSGPIIADVPVSQSQSHHTLSDIGETPKIKEAEECGHG